MTMKLDDEILKYLKQKKDFVLKDPGDQLSPSGVFK